MHSNIRDITAIFKRELSNYFETPIAYVFLVVFLILSGICTFYFGSFYETGQATLETFFIWHPWLYLLLVPASTMRLWSEEKKSGTIELLLTLPISEINIILGKFFAAWLFTAFALFLTFPVWITVNYLGSPDNGIIISGYIGSLLVAGSFIAIGLAMSAITNNQVIAFVLTVSICFLLSLTNSEIVTSFLEFWLPQIIIEAIASISVISHYTEIIKGVISLNNLIHFSATIILAIYINKIIIQYKRL